MPRTSRLTGGAPRQDLAVKAGSQGRPESCHRWLGRLVPHLALRPSLGGSRPVPASQRPKLPSSPYLAHFRQRRARSKAQVAPRGPLTGHQVPDRGANSTLPSRPRASKGPRGRREGSGQRGPGRSGSNRALPGSSPADGPEPPSRDPSWHPGAGDAPRPPRRGRSRTAGSPGQQPPPRF